MSWAAIQDGLRIWVRDATGLADDHVIWADQNGPRPAPPFADLRIGSTIPLGATDEVSDSTDLGRPAGQEVELRATSVQEFHVTIRLFTDETLDDNAALSLLGTARLTLALPTKRAALAEAGLTVFDRGEVQNLTALKDTVFEGRAMLEIGCYTIESISEYVGYWATAEIIPELGPPGQGTREGIDI